MIVKHSLQNKTTCYSQINDNIVIMLRFQVTPLDKKQRNRIKANKQITTVCLKGQVKIFLLITRARKHSKT